MRVVKLETYFYVPDDVSTRDVGNYVTHEAQAMYGIAERMTAAFEAKEPIKWTGVVYQDDGPPSRWSRPDPVYGPHI